MSQYIHQPYPSTRYHETLPPIVVKDEDEDKALSEDWKKIPFPKPPPVKKLTYEELEKAHNELLVMHTNLLAKLAKHRGKQTEPPE